MTQSKGKPMNDEDMLAGCQENNENAQKHLFERYARIMTAICLRYVDSYEEAQDVVQNGFIKVFKKINTFSSKGSLEGWIKRIMVNTSLDYLRKIKHERFHLSIEDVDYRLRDQEEIIESMQADDLLKVIQTLPTGYRTVFNMYAIEGYSHKEIAEKLEISENTSKSQYSRARTLLQKKLEQQNVKR